MIVDFMKKADIKTDYFFFILTCGYGYEVSLGHAEVAARERGWDLKYGNTNQRSIQRRGISRGRGRKV